MCHYHCNFLSFLTFYFTRKGGEGTVVKRDIVYRGNQILKQEEEILQNIYILLLKLHSVVSSTPTTSPSRSKSELPVYFLPFPSKIRLSRFPNLISLSFLSLKPRISHILSLSFFNNDAILLLSPSPSFS